MIGFPFLFNLLPILLRVVLEMICVCHLAFCLNHLIDAAQVSIQSNDLVITARKADDSPRALTRASVLSHSGGKVVFDVSGFKWGCHSARKNMSSAEWPAQFGLLALHR